MASFTECICAAACPMAMAAKSVALRFLSTSALQLAQRHCDHVELARGGDQVILRGVSIRAPCGLRVELHARPAVAVLVGLAAEHARDRVGRGEPARLARPVLEFSCDAPDVGVRAGSQTRCCTV